MTVPIYPPIRFISLAERERHSADSAPWEAGFAAAEVTRGCDLEALTRTCPELAGMKILRDSDSHYLETLATGEPLGLHLPELSRRAVIQAIRAGAGE